MTQVFDVAPVLVTGPTSNPIMLMYLLMGLAQDAPSQIVMVMPAHGEVDGHSIVVVDGATFE